MTVAALSLNSHEAYLTDSEVDAFCLIAQDVPITYRTETVTDDDGTERQVEITVYGTTPEADDALAALTKAFLPLIHKVARTSRVLKEDDALMVCLEEFISVIRRYEVGSALPLKAGLRTILLRKMGDTGRTDGLIVVRENVAARYRQLMDKHEWNLEAAYAECRDTPNGFDPDTFLKVHNSLGVDSLDVSAADDPNNSGPSTSGISDQSQHRSYLADPDPSPEAITVQAETIRYLFDLVPDEQEAILRLSYGFTDLATENARMAKGYRADGSPMSDREVAHVLGMTTPTVGRRRNAALSTMRDALTEDDEAA